MDADTGSNKVSEPVGSSSSFDVPLETQLKVSVAEEVKSISFQDAILAKVLKSPALCSFIV